MQFGFEVELKGDGAAIFRIVPPARRPTRRS
jgi:hypothetical protein